MRRIALISLSTPTFNNVRAASALPYHLMLGAEACGDTEFEIWSFNINDVKEQEIKETEENLKTKVHLVDKPWWYRWMFKLHLVFLRILFRYPLLSYFRLSDQSVKDIADYRPDIVWIYGEELFGLARHFKNIRVIATGPDCESMYYHRCLTKNWMTDRLSKVMRYAFAYWQYRGMEKEHWQKRVTYHFVGERDAAFFKDLRPEADVRFIRHPHYAWRTKTIRFHSPKIRLLFAGRYDLYCQHGTDDLLKVLDDDLGRSFEITFLGKGWDHWCEQLRARGWTVSIVNFAPDYIEELQKHDIQVNAIDIGTGTKGKVLDAISNGLLELGTPYALENIAVKHGESCLIFHSPSEAISLLKDIAACPTKYEQIAEKGQQCVLNEHARKKVATELFNIINTNKH